MASKQDKILFVSVQMPSFVRQDHEFLRELYEVRKFEFGIMKGAQMFARQIQLLFWVLGNIWGAKYVYIWFADYHALIPSLMAKLLGKPVFLVMAGYDAANLPEYRYGAFIKPVRGWFVRQNTKLADEIFPLSHFLVRQLEQNTQRTYGDKIKVTHLGGPINQFKPEPGLAKDGSVICVSGGADVNRMKIKGVDFYAEVARQCPEVQFIVVGITGDAKTWLDSIKPDNLQVLGWTKREELVALYNRASVVCQFSRYEGFGMVLLEGMLCECVPVSVVGIGPAEVIDEECGFLIPEYDPKQGADRVRKAIQQQAQLGPVARQKVVNGFAMQHRIDRLMGVINKY
ncbi:MAG: glycosyltransferase family 4 protein [Bacteroidota bacterium]